MAVPKKRTSKARKRQRRSHRALVVPGMAPCPDCGEPRAPHRACPSCGRYRGRQVVEVETEEEV